MPLFLALLSHALADEPYVERYPWAVGVAGTGKGLFLYDVAGQPLPMRAALDYLGDPALSQRVKDAHKTRVFASTALWIAGGALVLGGSQVSDLESDTPRQVVMLSGLALVGAGVSARVVGPGRHLGDWVDRPRLEAAIAAHQEHASVPTAPADAASLELGLTSDHHVIDGEGADVSIPHVALRFGEEDVAEAYWVESRRARTTWLPMIIGGGGLAGAGLFTLAIGSIMNGESYDGGDPLLPLLGLGGAVVGGGLVSGAWVAWVHAVRRSHDYDRWFGEDVLPQRIRSYNLGIHETLSASLHVEVVLGPGSLGLTGTF